MEDSIYLAFLGFSALWVLMGVGIVVWITKQENQGLKLGNRGLLIGLSILLPFLLALLYGAIKLS